MPIAAASLAQDGLPPAKRKLALTIIAIGTVMAVLDSSIANVALPTLARELHVDAATSVWIVNAYQVAVTMLLIPFASLGDVVGYRRVYALGLVVFTLGSLGCALAASFAALVAWRVFQGIGAAALMSIAPALMRTIFPRAMLGTAVGISALTVATSSAAGPALGGVVLAVAAWPWIFAVNVPLGILASAFANRALPATPGTGKPFDIASAFLSGPALTLFILGLGGIARHPSPEITAATLVASLAFAIAFVRRQAAIAHPMLPLDLFAIRRFSLASATSLCSFTAQGLAIVALPFLLQGPYGFSPLAASLLFVPWPLTIAVVAPLAGRLSDRVPAPLISTIGLTVLAIGLTCLAAIPPHPGAADIVWRAAICGCGFGLFQAPNNRELLGSVPRARSGSAGGILATLRLVGQSIGAALVGILLGNAGGERIGATLGSGGLAEPAHLAIVLSAGVATLAAAVSATRLLPLRKRVPIEGV